MEGVYYDDKGNLLDIVPDDKEFIKTVADTADVYDEKEGDVK